MTTAQDVYAAALKAGFSSAQAIILTVASQLESNYGTQVGNGGGLLQFEPGTWQAAHGVGNAGSATIQQQLDAAHNLIGSNFLQGWYTHWFVPENKQGGVTIGTYTQSAIALEAALGTGETGARSLLAEAGSTLGGNPSGQASGNTNTSGSNASPTGSGAAQVIGNAAAFPGDVLSGAAGWVSSQFLGKIEALIPYLVIGAGLIISFVFLLKELSGHVDTSQVAGAMEAAE